MDRAASPPTSHERRSPTPAALRTRDAIRRLKAAMDGKRFVLHYQPLVGAGDGAVKGVEALLRWRHPDREKDDITELLLAAEKGPVIFKIENWTLGEAFRAAAVWTSGGLAGVRVNVNLSAREFLRADLVRRVEREIAAAGIAAEGVGLEITETSRMSEFDAVASKLDRLSGMGVEMWLDDFGTGHSSLEWLIRLPVHGVKIPGGFVERLFSDARCPAVVGRVIDLAHDLGLQVIAEGVETEEQREFLAGRGCDLLQGFLLHAPMEARALPAALAGSAKPRARTDGRPVGRAVMKDRT